MTVDSNVGRQILLNACRSMKDEHTAFRFLRSKGLNEGEVIHALRRVGVITKIRVHKGK